MAKIISKNVIEEIRAQNDIAEVVGSYLQLKRAGSSFKTLCPFHKEKTPSFHVNPQRQIYHCFGCGAGGDVFRFVMEYEGVDFATAAKMLADRVGIRVELEEDKREGGIDKDLLYRINEEAATLFHRVLLEKDMAEQARAYLRKRELPAEMIEAFQIGYAPDRPDTMRRLAEKKKFPLEQVEKAGLIARAQEPRDRSSPYYDRFRNRLMFPIRNEIGRVIGFSGRVLEGDKRPAKYVNSPETPLFRKSRVLFAFDKARRAIVDQRKAIICEGQIDAIRCHQEGVENVVASQGTALTAEHARVLKRYADEVVLVLDADKAGQDAALRSAEHFIAAGLSLAIASLPPGEDPDSLILRQGRRALDKLVDEAQSVLDFQIDVLGAREDVKTEVGLMRTTRAVLDTIRQASSAVQRDQLLKRAAARLQVDEKALREDLERMGAKRPASRVGAEGAPKPRVSHPPHERALAELLFAHGEVAELVSKYLPLTAMQDAICRTIVEKALAHRGDTEWNLVAELEGEDDECIRLAAEVQMAPLKVQGEDVSPEHAARDLVLAIRRKDLERKRKAVREELGRSPSPEKELLSKELTHDINTLRQGWDRALPILEL